MKRVILSVLTLATCLSFTGCKTKAPSMESDENIFGYMQGEVEKITEQGGMAALGMAKSRDTATAIKKAKLSARTSMAQLVSVKIENLEKAFIEEIGEAATSEMNELFSSATKQITNQELIGSVPKMQKYEEIDGVTSAYVLMVMNPDLIHDALKKQNNAKHLYERFRASKAFEELDKEIKEYEAAENAGMM